MDKAHPPCHVYLLLAECASELGGGWALHPFPYANRSLEVCLGKEHICPEGFCSLKTAPAPFVSYLPDGTISGGSSLPSWKRGNLLLFGKDAGVTLFSSCEASHGQRGQSEACMGCPVSSVKWEPPYVSLHLRVKHETRRPQCYLCCMSNTFGAQSMFLCS